LVSDSLNSGRGSIRLQQVEDPIPHERSPKDYHSIRQSQGSPKSPLGYPAPNATNFPWIPGKPTQAKQASYHRSPDRCIPAMQITGKSFSSREPSDASIIFRCTSMRC
jgi:hypothetical protein